MDILHNKLWLALGGDELRLIVNKLIQQREVDIARPDIQITNLYWVIRVKLQNEIDERYKG